MRDITKVLAAMRKHIPESEKSEEYEPNRYRGIGISAGADGAEDVDYPDLGAALKDLQYRASFSAPEVQSRFWVEGAKILMHFLKDAKKEKWHDKVIETWKGEPL